ncbi:MAG: electron transport complex subunit RsxG [Porticoccaceae bacterium]|nr:electron transport complex subunit RsxG [Porticoccaceae bacterium]
MMFKAITKNSLGLALAASITAALLSMVNSLTADKIAYSERLFAQKALLEIVPKNLHDNDLLLDIQPIPERFWPLLGLEKKQFIHIARRNENPIAAIIPSATLDGYSGKISMLVGINADSTIAGVRVVEHRETPGLGDKIEIRRSSWILSFNGRSLKNTPDSAWAVKKHGGDFDQFTGATITPRAVINQLVSTLTYFEQDNARIFSAKTAIDVSENN